MGGSKAFGSAGRLEEDVGVRGIGIGIIGIRERGSGILGEAAGFRCKLLEGGVVLTGGHGTPNGAGGLDGSIQRATATFFSINGAVLAILLLLTTYETG